MEIMCVICGVSSTRLHSPGPFYARGQFVKMTTSGSSPLKSFFCVSTTFSKSKQQFYSVCSRTCAVNMTKVVSARDLIPNLYNDESNSENDSSDDENEAVKNREDLVDDLHYDVRNLMACNYHPVRFLEGQDKESVLVQTAQRAAQLLMKKIFDCPVEPSDVGPLVILPSEITVLPRSHKLLEEKPETKWEKFAKEKGIKKTKRDRMVFDEESDEFKPRFGYKRAKNGIEDIPIIEVKPGQDPYADPWSEARNEKKDRVKKNEKNQLQNQKRAMGKKGGPRSYDPESVPGIPLDISKNGKAQRGKAGVRRALQLAQHSTASMGRFDEMRSGEPMRKIQGKKRSFRDNIASTGDNDKSAMKAQLRIVADKVDKKARGVTNSLAAYEGILPDAPTDAFRQRKGKGKEKSAGEMRTASRPGKGKHAGKPSVKTGKMRR